MRHEALLEAKKFKRGQLEIAIVKREAAIRDEQKKIQVLAKRQAKFGATRDKSEPSDAAPRSKAYLKALAELRKVTAPLAFCCNWVAQKARVLRDKRGKLGCVKAQIQTVRLPLCCGSKKLRAAPSRSQHRVDALPVRRRLARRARPPVVVGRPQESAQRQCRNSVVSRKEAVAPSAHR